MYIKIKNGTKTKEYTLTESYEKPYLHVKSSVLPLTTNTTNGFHLKMKNNGKTYRPLEYKSSTIYTTAANPGNMSSTTALTYARTYATIYRTKTRATIVSIIGSSSTLGVTGTPHNQTLLVNNYTASSLISQARSSATFYFSGNPVSMSYTNSNGGTQTATYTYLQGKLTGWTRLQTSSGISTAVKSTASAQTTVTTGTVYYTSRQTSAYSGISGTSGWQ